MKKVFITNNGGHDYSDAQRFGEIVFCIDASIRKSDIAQMYRELSAALKDAQPDDYLLVSSLTSLCCVATAILSDRFGEVHFLLFKDGEYIEKSLVLDNDQLTQSE